MEKNIVYEFDAKHYASSLHLCNMLLKHDKDNELAVAYLAKIEAIEPQDKPEAE